MVQVCGVGTGAGLLVDPSLGIGEVGACGAVLLLSASLGLL